MKHDSRGSTPAIAQMSMMPAVHSNPSSSPECPPKSRYRQLALAGTALQNCEGKPDIPAKLRETRTHSDVLANTIRAAAKFREEEGANQNRSQCWTNEFGDGPLTVADTRRQAPARS